MKSAILFGMLLHGFGALAAGPTIQSVGGASGFSATGTPTIFGGLAGNDCSSNAPDQYTPCNSCQTSFMDASCTTSPLCPCNSARIYDGLVLTIYVSNSTTDANGATTTTSGNAILTGSSTSTTTTTTGTTALTPINQNNGGNSVSVYWRQVCALASGSDCTSITTNGTTLSLNVCTDTNNNNVADSGEPCTAISVRLIKPPNDYATFGSVNSQGIGSFTPYPGDGKVYIHEPQTTTDFPSLGYSSVIRSVRVYVSDKNLTDANPTAASQTTDLPVSDDGSSLAKNIVGSLTNDTRYFFRLGMLDEANNSVMYSPDPAVDTDAANSECSSPTGTDQGACKYSAKPSQVEGILPNDLNCFVATAAYGTVLEPKLRTFREFRNRVLQSTRAGRYLTLVYYRWGPHAARFIADKPVLRAATRAALWPAFAISWLSVRYGFARTTIAMALLTMMLAIVGRRRGVRARA